MVSYEILLNRRIRTKIGKSIQTLKNLDKNISLKPSHITDSGTRYYSQEQLNHFLGIKGIKDVETKTKK